ncbi:hypothetical protein PSPO01_12393 [Paraphaeosphaeria sporulosa]
MLASWHRLQMTESRQTMATAQSKSMTHRIPKPSYRGPQQVPNSLYCAQQRRVLQCAAEQARTRRGITGVKVPLSPRQLARFVAAAASRDIVVLTRLGCFCNLSRCTATGKLVDRTSVLTQVAKDAQDVPPHVVHAPASILALAVPRTVSGEPGCFVPVLEAHDLRAVKGCTRLMRRWHGPSHLSANIVDGSRIGVCLGVCGPPGRNAKKIPWQENDLTARVTARACGLGVQPKMEQDGYTLLAVIGERDKGCARSATDAAMSQDTCMLAQAAYLGMRVAQYGREERGGGRKVD